MFSWADDASPITPVNSETSVITAELPSEPNDLMSYEDVRASATLIYERVNDRTMPCDQPWSTAEIAVFSNWLETGCAP